jgi:hypothetical protein
MLNASQVAVGTVEGTGAAINVSTGFEIAYVKVVNVEDGDTIHEWFYGMTDGHAIKSANHASAQFAAITSNGISAYAGSDSAAKGFTLGTDVSESGKTLRYIAFGR